MTVEERLKEWLPKVREAKQNTVDRFPDDPDSPTIIEIYRGDELVCTAMSMPNRDLTLMMLKFSIAGFEATEVRYSMEVASTKHPINPGTGQPWGPNEKVEVLRNHPDYWFDGLVEEGIVTTIWDKDGNAAHSFQKFTIEDGKVVWGKENIETDGATQGLIVDEVSMFWHDETLSDMAEATLRGDRPDVPPEMAAGLKEELEKMTPVEREARQDLVVLFMLKLSVASMGEQAAVMLHARKDSERAEVIRQHAGKFGLIFEEV